MTSITKQDLVQLVASSVGIPKAHAAAVVDSLLKSVVEALQRGERVELRGFGSFRLRSRGPRRARNPKTGEAVDVPAKRIPYFKPGKHLRQFLARATDELLS